MQHIRQSCRPFLVAAVLAIAAVAFATPATAQRVQWYVEALTDPISKTPILEARVLTQNGYAFKLMRMNDNSIWGSSVFHVPARPC